MTPAHGAITPRILKVGLPALVSARAVVARGKGHPTTPEGTTHASDAMRLITAVTLGGVSVDLMSFENATALIIGRAVQAGSKPLAVLSANLDHVNHFGSRGQWRQTLENQDAVHWLTLLDGAPLVTQANRLTAQSWPRLAGSDLVESILDRAEAEGLRIGFLGGLPETQRLVRAKLALERPAVNVVGWWAPPRESLENRKTCRELCRQISDAKVDLLFVCLGKPRQELWIAEYGPETGAKVLLAFGAVVDFLAGRVPRAPAIIRGSGLEWAWRLILEPRRLARRYLLEGPASYVSLRRNSSAIPITSTAQSIRRGQDAAEITPGKFAALTEHTDVAVLIVTYNNQDDIDSLIRCLRRETADQSMKVVVADNSPSRHTLDALASQADVLSFPTGGNKGYAGGLNLAMRQAGTADAYLILNPDLWLAEGAVKALRDRLQSSSAGIVVPKLLEKDGSTYRSLRREPRWFRSLGDAFLGSKLSSRPGWLSETDFDPESYIYPHPVEWATGAAMLVSSKTAANVGDWDESFFLYSEETDFFRRARDVGEGAWYEPKAEMTHAGGGSGSSPQLEALMTVNRVRYSRKHSSATEALLAHATVMAAEVIRIWKPGHLIKLLTVTGLRSWEHLPKAYNYPDVTADVPEGSVIIPAHNESTVLGRTLKSLAPALRNGKVEVIVACNGCTDNTEAVARTFPRVRVVSVAAASKAAALNAADKVATKWPRIYLDADIELGPGSLVHTLRELAQEEGPLAARPPFVYDTIGASWLVRAYYRARNRIPSASSALWGAGVYGLSKRGHQKLGTFPAFLGDDYYVEGLFTSDEKKILQCAPVIVRTPRTAGALLATLGRIYRGNTEQRGGTEITAAQTLLSLFRSVNGPVSCIDAAIYAAFALAGRSRRHGSPAAAWERDESSRSSGEAEGSAEVWIETTKGLGK